MKYIALIFVWALTLIAPTAFAQSKTVEDTITVQGVCGECKARIEEAAYIKGVKHAEWDKTTKILTVAYRSDKVSLREIEESIAAAGHSTAHVAANRTDYEALPACCQYEHVHDH